MNRRFDNLWVKNHVLIPLVFVREISSIVPFSVDWRKKTTIDDFDGRVVSWRNIQVNNELLLFLKFARRINPCPVQNYPGYSSFSTIHRFFTPSIAIGRCVILWRMLGCKDSSQRSRTFLESWMFLVKIDTFLQISLSCVLDVTLLWGCSISW